MFFTIGHSSRPWEEFVGLLHRHKISVVADVRKYPSSKVWPQYNEAAMADALAKEHIAYVHLGKLGGRRSKDGSGKNAGWENAAFQGYADYMATDEFKEGVKELLELKGVVAIMCAEAVPWRCHRRIISDYLTAQSIEVFEIIGEAAPKVHELTSFALVKDGVLTYPLAQKKLFFNDA